ncbi:hypothetical protein CTAYLR_004504 [Chrysophaeum taylorii]|uniref:SH3 domain-containing protein n=1 Tax=Chrysophaeum taylorii TaxID=2483200 RepID=A0AAD7XM39_9STRA|nr:hypothetical protein CTAYLR_004504 [Chrysophaeum taylorii]
MPDSKILAVCVARCRFEAQSVSEMSMAEGERVLVVRSELSGGWILADSIDTAGHHGYVPAAFLAVAETFEENLDGYAPASPQSPASWDLSTVEDAQVPEGTPNFQAALEDFEKHLRGPTPAPRLEFPGIVDGLVCAQRVVRERLPIFVLFADSRGDLVRLCFRARGDRLRRGLSTKAKNQIIKKFFQKRPDLLEADIHRYRADFDTPSCATEAKRPEKPGGGAAPGWVMMASMSRA